MDALKEMKEYLAQEDKFLEGFRHLADLLESYVGVLVGGGLKPNQAIGIAMSNLGTALDDLRFTKAVLEEGGE